MEPIETENRVREPYDAPLLRTIELTAEETLGTGCKVEPFEPGLISTCVPIGAGGCMNLGS